jgi:hypothetical protein
VRQRRDIYRTNVFSSAFKRIKADSWACDREICPSERWRRVVRTLAQRSCTSVLQMYLVQGQYTIVSYQRMVITVIVILFDRTR